MKLSDEFKRKEISLGKKIYTDIDLQMDGIKEKYGIEVAYGVSFQWRDLPLKSRIGFCLVARWVMLEGEQ